MATKKQIEANRLNALKSTGPSTAGGKARSSMNALKTGIDSRTQTIRGEIYDDLMELKGEYYHRYCPFTPAQRMLVDALIDAEWMLRRLRAVETQLWAKADLTDTSLADTYSANCDRFDRLQRRVNATQRNFRTALHELERLQAEEAGLPADAEPVTVSNQTANPTNGFVPQPPPKAPCTPPPATATFAILTPDS